MALRWMEGFENCRISELLARKYDVFTGSGAAGISNTTVGWQGVGFCLEASGSAASACTFTTPALVVAVENTWILGWAWAIDNAGGLSGSQTSFPSIELHDGVGQQLQIEMIAANATKPGGGYWKIQVRRGSTVLATGTKLFQPGKFYYIEAKVTVRPGTDGSVEVQWWRLTDTVATNDILVSGINTANQGTDGADRVKIQLISEPVTTAHLLLDDIYICDDTGAINNDFLGKQVIEGITPSANGNYLEWSLQGSAASLEDAWNESATVQSDLEDDKRTQSDTTDQRELAAYSNLSVISLVSITGLMLHTQHRMDTSGSRGFCPLLRKTTGTPADAEGTTVTVVGTDETGSSEMFELDPNTAAAWTVTNVNAAEFGVKTKA